MRYLIGVAAAGILLGGCAASGPSDSAQQAMVQEFSPDKVAQEYEKAGKHKEAEEIRRSLNRGDER